MRFKKCISCNSHVEKLLSLKARGVTAEKVQLKLQELPVYENA